MTILQPKQIQAGYEPLPGYVLEEAVGRGGFGEVWRCSAPGGMKKAAKFVFGTQDESRASRELRSLERIKGVRHPFLLTLERFEIVNDQLVIITELAEESLEDVYNRHRKAGSCGIPRDILVSHLHDAADALDYLHHSYQLQHLDVKPGNLLMIGGHVKVADFGLLKDLRDVECSVVGGLTPIYAPPEVFDGRPSLHSDQYSLAVMYQELLTGSRPFSGRTIAQLATQHVHSPPNLEPLPASDRVVAARALEKDPQSRFNSCREFVDALIDSRKSKLIAAANVSNTIEEKAAEVEDLPQIGGQAEAEKSNQQKNVLVIALGGTGAECVRELRRRVADMRIVSDVKLNSILIDTDMTSIHSMRVAEASDRVPKCNLIYTPLRPAMEYRNAGTDRLKTISRRWIYNVPRSGATEGMRPLGRLALVDHGEQVQSQLKKSLEELVKQTGVDHDAERPQVFLVGSLAGGTASGMYIDVVHLLRNLMDECGFADTKILSLLATSPLHADPRNPLSVHGTQAAIREISHFMQAGNGYPGDKGAGWPSVPAARTPLRDAYLVAGSSDTRYGVRPVETIVEYIWASSNGCEKLLSKARQVSEEESADGSSTIQRSGSLTVRSVGVIPLGDSRRLEERILGPSLVRDVLKAWLGNPSVARGHSAKFADRMSRRIGLSAEHIREQLEKHSEGPHGKIESQPGLDEDVNSHQFRSRESDDADGTVARQTVLLSQQIHDGQFDWLCAGWVNNLHREISVGLADRRLDVATVIEALNGIHQHAVRIAAKSCGNGANQMLCMVAEDQLQKFQTSVKQLVDRMECYATIVAIAITELGSRCEEVDPWPNMPESISEQKTGLMLQLHDQCVNSMMVRPLNDHSSTMDAQTLVVTMMDRSIKMVTPILQQSSQAVQVAASDDQSSTDLRTWQADASANDAPTQHLENASRTAADATQALPSLGGDAKIEPMTLEDAVELAKPSLLTLGGAQRLILVVSNEIERGRLEPELRAIYDGAITVAIIPGSDPKLIHEAQRIELKNIAEKMSILGGNAHVTSRLASRTDVDW